MSKYRKFESYLRSYLGEELNTSYIADLVNEGARTAIFSVNSNGSFKFSFSGGHATWGKTYKNLDSFYKSSEMLEDLEGLGYAFITACLSAEKSMKSGKPKVYDVKLTVYDIGDYVISVILPEE